MKYEKAVKKLFSNKYFLYFVLFLSITNLFGYLMMRNFNAIIIFLVVGVLMYSFSKNMAVILLVCLVVTNLLMSRNFLKEGFEGTTTTTPSKEEKKEETKPATKPAATMPATPDPTMPAATSTDEPESSTLTNAIASEHVGATEPMSTFNKKTNSKLDYSATVQDAYKGLNDLLDPEAIKSLTTETRTLMQEQQKLFKSMEAMSPLLSSAKGLLEGMDVSSLKGLADIASSFKGSLKV